MLKIKNNVDLKELEKFGFKNIPQYCDSECYRLKTDFVCIEIMQRIISIEHYEFDYYVFYELDILYDLIQAGLVEKVE